MDGAKHTLRSRLTLAYAAALLVALTAFAALALLTIDSVQRHLLESELVAVARDEASAMAYDAETNTIGAAGSARFGAVAGSRVASALLADDGRPLVASAARVPSVIVQAAGAASSEVARTVRDGTTDIRTVLIPLPIDGGRHATIATWSDIGPIERVDRKIGWVFAIAIPFVTLLATLFGNLIARRGLAPLDRIIASAAAIEASDLGVRIAQPDTVELDRLAATLNRTFARLQAAFARERRFTSDASHEFRAPLAVILAEADLALSASRPAAEYRRSLEAIALEAEAMERLTRDLLSSLRGNGAERVHTERVELGDVVRAACSRMRVLAGRRAIRIDVDADGTDSIAAEAGAVEQAVVTVVHNAIKFAHSRCSVHVECTTAESLEVHVRDDGPGFSPAALSNAFDRFWRDAGPDRDTGFGLGLPIARSIVERFGGTIALTNPIHGGALVTMRFPAAAPARAEIPA